MSFDFTGINFVHSKAICVHYKGGKPGNKAMSILSGISSATSHACMYVVISFLLYTDIRKV